MVPPPLPSPQSAVLLSSRHAPSAWLFTVLHAASAYCAHTKCAAEDGDASLGMQAKLSVWLTTFRRISASACGSFSGLSQIASNPEGFPLTEP